MRSPRSALWWIGLCAGPCVGLVAPAAAQQPAGPAAVDCLILPESEVTLSSPVEAQVAQVLVDRGDRVEEGQVVARLESSVEQASVEVARASAEAEGPLNSSRARAEVARRELDRQLRLEEQDVVSASDLDEARGNKQVADADVAAAQEARQVARLELRRSRAILERRTIRSPVSGLVVERILEPGEYADPPQILKLAQIDPLRVEVFAPLELYGKIEAGMTGIVEPEAPLGGQHAATVTVVDRVVDAASATFGVRLSLPNPDWSLPAGIKCRLRFDGASGAADAGPVSGEAETERTGG